MVVCDVAIKWQYTSIGKNIITVIAKCKSRTLSEWQQLNEEFKVDFACTFLDDLGQEFYILIAIDMFSEHP